MSRYENLSVGVLAVDSVRPQNGSQASAITDVTVTGTYATDDSNIETAINAILDALRGVGAL